MQTHRKWTEAQLTRTEEDQAQHRHQLLNSVKERLVRLPRMAARGTGVASSPPRSGTDTHHSCHPSPQQVPNDAHKNRDLTQNQVPQDTASRTMSYKNHIVVFWKGYLQVTRFSLSLKQGKQQSQGLGFTPVIFKYLQGWRTQSALAIPGNKVFPDYGTTSHPVTLMYPKTVFSCPKASVDATMGHHPVPFIDKLRKRRDRLCEFCPVLNPDGRSPSCGRYMRTRRVWFHSSS